MLPLIPVVLARAGWVVLGAAAAIAVKSKIGKEAVETFKDGVKGMGEDYRRDATAKQKRDLQEKEQLVKDIKGGHQ